VVANADDEWLSQSLRNAGAGAVKKGPAKLGKELITNGSFENTTGDMAAGWAVRTYRGSAQHRVADVAHTGKRSIEISAAKGTDSSVHFDLKVDRDSEYELSGWIKTENVVGGGHGALVSLHALQGQPRSKALKGTNDWTQVKVRFETGSANLISINCLFGGWGTATGKAWWDDVSLRKVEYEIIASSEPEVVKGDVVSGKKIFMTHPIAACIRCHAVNGVGGPIGPALDTIATRKQEDYILQSLVDPGATIAEGFQGKVSPMPPMGVLLTPQELADVMAYILTLK
jgi:mono/diheme cytochrome c family protein